MPSTPQHSPDGKPSQGQRLAIISVLAAALLLLGAAGFFASGYGADPAEPATQRGASATPPNASSTESPAAAAERLNTPEVNLAFSALFGVQVDADAAATATVATGVHQRSRLWFQTPFTQGGQRYWAQFFLSQALDDQGEPIDSHAQSVSISVITYAEQAQSWTMVGKQIDFTETGSYGDAPEAQAQLLQLSPARSAVLVQANAFGQGYSYAGKSVLLFDGQAWHNAGYIGTSEDNAGACDDQADQAPSPESSASGDEAEDGENEPLLAPCYAWEGSISVGPAVQAKPGGKPDALPDLLVQRHSTLSAEQEALRKTPDALSRLRVLYPFENGEYRTPPGVSR